MSEKLLPKSEDLGPVTLEQFLQYIRKDLTWLEGYGACLSRDGTSSNHIGARVHAITRLVKRLELGLRAGG